MVYFFIAIFDARARKTPALTKKLYSGMPWDTDFSQSMIRILQSTEPAAMSGIACGPSLGVGTRDMAVLPYAIRAWSFLDDASMVRNL